MLCLFLEYSERFTAQWQDLQLDNDFAQAYSAIGLGAN